jgi:hypothetical protein
MMSLLGEQSKANLSQSQCPQRLVSADADPDQGAHKITDNVTVTVPYQGASSLSLSPDAESEIP